MVLTSPPWGVLKDDEGGAVLPYDVGLDETEIHAFAARVVAPFEVCVSSAVVVLHLPLTLFDHYIKAFAAVEWEVLNQPFTVTGKATVRLTHAHATQPVKNTETFLVFVPGKTLANQMSICQ